MFCKANWQIARASGLPALNLGLQAVANSRLHLAERMARVLEQAQFAGLACLPLFRSMKRRRCYLRRRPRRRTGSRRKAERLSLLDTCAPTARARLNRNGARGPEEFRRVADAWHHRHRAATGRPARNPACFTLGDDQARVVAAPGTHKFLTQPMHGDEITRPGGLLLATKGRDFGPSSSTLGANGLAAARTPRRATSEAPASPRNDGR